MNDQVEYLPAREIAIRELNSMRGRLCTVIESLGLPFKQERAIIGLIKNFSFQNQAVIEQLLSQLDDGSKFTVINNKLQVVDK
jgi:hypothetical protein